MSDEPSMSSRLIDLFVDQHKERMEEAVALRGSVDVMVKKLDEKPGKASFYAVFGFLTTLVFLLLFGIYQLKGIDSSKAVRDVNVITNQLPT